jgi:hypothetical protein
MLKLVDPPSALLPPMTTTDLSRVQESLLRADEELRVDSALDATSTGPVPDAAAHAHGGHLAAAGTSSSQAGATPAAAATAEGPTAPIDGVSAATRSEGAQALPLAPPPSGDVQPSPFASSSFDLFCFNEGNSEEIDTSRDETEEPLSLAHHHHQQPHGAAIAIATPAVPPAESSAGIKGEAMDLDDYNDGFTGSGRPVDEKGAHSFALGQAMMTSGGENRGDGDGGQARKADDDIGIYAEEEIGDEWEEEMEAGAGGGGLDDSREDEEKDDLATTTGLHTSGGADGNGDVSTQPGSVNAGGGDGLTQQQDGLGSRLRGEKADKEGDRDQMWKAKFDQLKEFHDQNGHCEVKGRKNKALSAWIRRQRYVTPKPAPHLATCTTPFLF